MKNIKSPLNNFIIIVSLVACQSHTDLCEIKFNSDEFEVIKTAAGNQVRYIFAIDSPNEKRLIELLLDYTDTEEPVYSKYGLINSAVINEFGHSLSLSVFPNRIPIKSKFGDEIVEYTRSIAEDFHPDRVSLSSSELGSYTISIPYGVQDSVKLIHWKNWKINPQVNH